VSSKVPAFIDDDGALIDSGPVDGLVELGGVFLTPKFMDLLRWNSVGDGGISRGLDGELTAQAMESFGFSDVPG